MEKKLLCVSAVYIRFLKSHLKKTRFGYLFSLRHFICEVSLLPSRRKPVAVIEIFKNFNNLMFEKKNLQNSLESLSQVEQESREDGSCP